jgi:hypothetical protein
MERLTQRTLFLVDNASGGNLMSGALLGWVVRAGRHFRMVEKGKGTLLSWRRRLHIHRRIYEEGRSEGYQRCVPTVRRVVSYPENVVSFIAC